MDKKTAAILALLVLVTITGIGWFSAELKPERVLPLPEGIENWVELFHGYEAYLDRMISYSIVSGTSMEPTFGENDKVLWVEVNPAKLKVGDIIIYEHPTKPEDGLIAHRIIEIMKNGEYRFETKGDNRSESDAETAISAYFVSEDDLKGLVIGVIYSAE
ncbi:MAG: signal peptidase I [Candidatus Hadarchaeaceae archaeon]